MFFNKKGTIFIIVMGICFVIVIICVSVYGMLLQDKVLSDKLLKRIQAKSLAEAGINDAIIKLMENWSAKDNPANFPVTSEAMGSYDVTINQSGGRVLVSSEGNVDDVTVTASVELKGNYPDMLHYSLGAGGNISIKSVQGNIYIKGDIHANGDILLQEQGRPTNINVQAESPSTGKVTASGELTLNGNVTIADSVNSGGDKDMIDLPTIDFGTLRDIAISEGVFYSGDQNFNNATLTGGSAGLIYVDGDVTFKNSNSVIGGFVCSGNVSLNNNDSMIQQHDANNRFPIFLSDGEIKSYGIFNTVEGNIVYATNSIKIRTPGGISTVLGCVITAGWFDIVANGDLTLTHSKVVNETFNETVDLVSWNR